MYTQRKDHVRELWRQPSPETEPTKTLILTLSPQNSEKINFCSWSHPVCIILLWQPKNTNADVFHFLSLLIWWNALFGFLISN
jgi:hypothetical protein